MHDENASVVFVVSEYGAVSRSAFTCHWSEMDVKESSAQTMDLKESHMSLCVGICDVRQRNASLWEMKSGLLQQHKKSICADATCPKIFCHCEWNMDSNGLNLKALRFNTGVGDVRMFFLWLCGFSLIDSRFPLTSCQTMYLCWYVVVGFTKCGTVHHMVRFYTCI